MEKYCDLHTHSTYSDGTCTPVQILSKAEALGLSAVALTDHNTVAGVPDFLAAARCSSVEAIPGVELSTNYEETELHILGLFLPEAKLNAVTELTDHFNRKKEESNRLLIQNLNQAGYVLDYEEICSAHPGGTVNRAVIARALLEKGYVESVNEAFQGLLAKKTGFYIPPERLSSFEAIRFLGAIGAVPVLAHPFLNLKTEAALRQFLTEAVPQGLVAMETLYPSFSPEVTALAQSMAWEFGLKQSGGSDFHGQNKPHIALGTGKGSLSVPSSIVDELKNSR